MKRIAVLPGAVLVMCVVVTALAGPVAQQQRAGSPVIVETRDGSRIVGVTEISTVEFAATYGRMDIAAAEINTITFHADLETATIAMRNGDSMKGVLGVHEITVTGLLGTITVRTADIVKVSFPEGDPEGHAAR